MNDHTASVLGPLLPDGLEVASGGVRLAGFDLEDLANQWGTPLYLYDAATLRDTAQSALRAFARLPVRVSYAAKACALAGVLRVFRTEGLSLDAVSEGELTVALRAGFRGPDIHVHGNFKSDTELRLAVELGVHAVVLDNLEETARLEAICATMQRRVPVLVRLALPLQADTHPHLRTSGFRNKFGFYRGSDEEAQVYEALAASRWLRMQGLHVHLGSQLTDPTLFTSATGELLQLRQELNGLRLPCNQISVGGGWAVPYMPGDASLGPDQVAAALEGTNPPPQVSFAVEPGRALVARAGLALYRVGSVKRFGGARIIAVDGGMGDNPRPALYGARYSAFTVRNPVEAPLGPVDIAGRYCESGDYLAHDVPLPEVRAGDLVCVPVAGAYQLAMRSEYNLVPAPAALLVDEGKIEVLLARGDEGGPHTV